MPNFELNEEHAIDLVLFWFTGIDGQLTYEEINAVENVLNQLNYDPTELHGRTMNYVSSLSTSKIDALIEDAKTYIKNNFSKDRKILVLHLLDFLASSDDIITKKEAESLKSFKKYLGV